MNRTTGVWCWKPSAADVLLARELGFDRLDIMINDLSAQRRPIGFLATLPWRREKLCDVAKMAIDAGIREVHFTAWAMPHQVHMAYAADCLQWLCRESGAHGVVLDAEEPWTRAVRPFREEAADMFFMYAAGLRVGITGIGYADVTKLAPLMSRADYGAPQCYSTKSSDLAPDEVGRATRHWSDFGKPLVPALAAYRQSGIPGYTTRHAMRSARATLADYDTVLYWSLRQIKGNPLVRETLKRMIADARASEKNVA